MAKKYTATIKVLTYNSTPSVIRCYDIKPCDAPIIETEIEFVLKCTYQIAPDFDENDIQFDVIDLIEIESAAMRTSVYIGDGKHAFLSEWVAVKPSRFDSKFMSIAHEELTEHVIDGKPDHEFPVVPTTTISIYEPHVA